MASVANRLHKLAAAEELSEALLKLAAKNREERRRRKEGKKARRKARAERDVRRAAARVPGSEASVARAERQALKRVDPAPAGLDLGDVPEPKKLPGSEPAPKPAPVGKPAPPAGLSSAAGKSGGPSGRAAPVKKAPARWGRKRLAAAALVGGGLAYGAHRMRQKQASVAEYSVLFDKVASGELGEGPRQALYGICQAVEVPQLSEKTASVYDASNLTEEDARKARLDQLLKR